MHGENDETDARSEHDTEYGDKVTASLYVKNDEGVTQVVERAFESSQEAFEEGQDLLESVEEDSRINEGEYCYVKVGRYVDAGTDQIDCPHCEDGTRHPDDGACPDCARRFADAADEGGRL